MTASRFRFAVARPRKPGRTTCPAIRAVRRRQRSASMARSPGTSMAPRQTRSGRAAPAGRHHGTAWRDWWPAQAGRRCRQRSQARSRRSARGGTMAASLMRPGPGNGDPAAPANRAQGPAGRRRAGPHPGPERTRAAPLQAVLRRSRNGVLDAADRPRRRSGTGKSVRNPPLPPLRGLDALVAIHGNEDGAPDNRNHHRGADGRQQEDKNLKRDHDADPCCRKVASPGRIAAAVGHP